MVYEFCVVVNECPGVEDLLHSDTNSLNFISNRIAKLVDNQVSVTGLMWEGRGDLFACVSC